MSPEENQQMQEQIGQRLQKLKIDHRKSNKEIAAFLGITPQAYNSVERGKTNISLDRIIDLARYYGVPVTDIVPEKYFTHIVSIFSSLAKDGDFERLKGNGLVISMQDQRKA